MELFSAFYLLLIAALCLFGLHRYWLVWESRRAAPRTASASSGDESAGADSWTPRVLIQIPIYNEDLGHVERLIDSAVAVDWPRSSLSIQVLDDSDDGTSERLGAGIERRRADGIPIEHIRRSERVGYKAGALQHGLARSSAEFVAIFDADFVVPADFLRRTVVLFRNPQLAMVQARWGHLNEDRNLLTRVQSVLLDGHFRVEHKARWLAGRFFNFNGTAGIWRAAAIRDAGGWKADTITEDIDLSLRAWLRDWQFVYLDDLVVMSELPETMPAYKVQQNRWVSGSLQTACRYLGTVIRSHVGLRAKIDTSFYLLGNLSYPVLLLLALAIPAAMLLRMSDAGDLVLWSDIPFFLLATLSVYVYASRVRGARGFWGYYCVRLPALMALGIGMTLHNTRAIVKGIAGRARVFERTPKRTLSLSHLRRGRRDVLAPLEGLMTLYILGCVSMDVIRGSFLGLPFLCLLAAGYGYVLLQSLFPDLGEPSDSAS